MHRTLTALALAALCALPACAEKLIPAGSILNCTISEGKVSSKTLDVGDPVLCRLSPMEHFGNATFPYGSYLVGRFEAYKDPGHLVGKGWMELKFDRLVVNQTDQVIPISTRVIEVPKSKYPVDKEGRIHGSGHAVKDTVTWLIPVLWPIDLINLPRRGPTPVLKPETRLTLRLMDDFGLPTKYEIRDQIAHDEVPTLHERQELAAAAPIERQAPQQYAPVQQYAPPQQTAPQTVIYNYPQQQQPQVQYVQGPTQYVQGPTQYVQGPTQYIPGPTQYVQGPTQYVPVPVRTYPPRIYMHGGYGY